MTSPLSYASPVVPVDNTFVKTDPPKIIKPDSKTVPSISTKDEKKITESSTKPVKSKPVDFVDTDSKPKPGGLNLSDHRIIATTSKVIGEEIGKKVTEKTVVKSVGKIAEKTATKTIGKTLAKSIAENTLLTVVTSGTEVATLKVMEKSAEKAAVKGSSELSKKLSGAVPVVGAIMEVGFTLWDAKYAYDLTKDKKASTVSKVLAWSTVGLDIVSTITVATGVGAPIGWAATGLGIGTAVLSDMLR